MRMVNRVSLELHCRVETSVYVRTWWMGWKLLLRYNMYKVEDTRLYKQISPKCWYPQYDRYLYPRYTYTLVTDNRNK